MEKFVELKHDLIVNKLFFPRRILILVERSLLSIVLIGLELILLLKLL